MSTSTTTTKSTQPIDPDDVRQKFSALRDVLRTELYERDAEIDCMLVALVARAHMVSLGEPGVAKTMQYKRLLSRISDVAIFDEQFRKTLPPDAVFGPVSIPGLKNEEFRFVTEGFLPSAQLAIFDEVFKASSTSLNGMLRIVLEREFRNNGVVTKVPLSSAFMASNEMPADDAEENLRAFWDRIELRIVTKAPADRASWRAIAKLRLDQDPPKVLTWDEILVAQAEARALPITDDLFDKLDEIRIKLNEVGMSMSPRRFNQAQYLAAARAWLDGAAEVRGEHLEPLVHSLWDQPDQEREVERIVLAVVSPGQRAALGVSDAIAEWADAVTDLCDNWSTSRNQELANELVDKAKRHKKAVEQMRGDVTGRAARTLEDAERTLDAAHRRLLFEAFSVDLDKLAGLSRG